MFRLFIFIIITIIIITIIIIFRPVFYKCLGHLSLLAGINSIVCCHCLFVIYLFILYTFTYLLSGLLIAVAPRYRYCSGATFTVAVAVGSAATFFSCFLALFATATF